jgi:hypothetical protein
LFQNFITVRDIHLLTAHISPGQLLIRRSIRRAVIGLINRNRPVISPARLPLTAGFLHTPAKGDGKES